MAEIEHDTGKQAPTRTAHLLYLLHALSPFTLWSLSLVAVIIGAINRDAVRGSWVETHYAWLLSTFIRGIVLFVALTVVFFISIIGILFIWLLWFALTVWYLYRVIRGWMRLNDGKPAP